MIINYLWWISCLISFVLAQSTCKESVESEKNTKWNIPADSGIRTHNLERRQTIEPIELAGLDESSF